MTLHVAEGGDDVATGSATSPLASVRRAIDLAAVAGGTWVVRVSGTHSVDSSVGDRVELQQGVSLEGGWNAAFDERDAARFPTVIRDIASQAPGSDRAATLLARGPIDRATRVEDITFVGAPHGEGHGALITQSASPTLRRCVFDGGGAIGGFGLRIDDAASPHVVDSEVLGGETENGFGLTFASIRAAPLIERTRFVGVASAGLNRTVITSGSHDVYRSVEIVGGASTAGNTVGLDIGANGHLFVDNSVVRAGAARRVSRGVFVQGGTRLQFRHNLIVGGSADDESIGVEIAVNNRAREFVNNIVQASAAGLSRCVSAAEPFDLFSHNNLDRCDVLWQLAATALATIDEVNGIASPDGFEPPLVTTSNVSVETALVDAGIDDRLRPDAALVLRQGGRDERTLVPTDAAGVIRTVPVSLGPFEID